MQSNNPVFRRSEEFNGQGGFANRGYPGGTATADPYAVDPTQWGTGLPEHQRAGDQMTIDTVVQKTGFSVGLVFVMAALTWWFTGDVLSNSGVIDQDNYGKLTLAMVVGTGGAFVLSLVNSFKREISPALVIGFAALEGVALGALSKFFDLQFGPGVVTGAVVGTFAAFAGTLAAYKFFNIQTTPKFRKFVVGAVLGMVALSVMELVLGLFGASIGLFGVSGLGMITAVVGLVLGVFMLIMDFEFVENGVAAGLPERESWRAAFAITVSLVWIYTNLLRILAFFSQD